MRFVSGPNRKLSSCSNFGRFEGLEDRIVLSLNPTGYEQEFLEHINRMRLDPAAELAVIFLNTTDPNSPNYFRAADANINAALDFFNVDVNVLQSQWTQLSATSPLAWSEGLMDAATAHSVLMQRHDLQSHQLPGESGIWDRIITAGYSWSGSCSVGENIFAYSLNPFYGHVGFAIDWGFSATGIQEPAGHRNNIMSSTFQEIGIGVVEDIDLETGVGPFLVTQDFGYRGHVSSRLLGVAYTDTDLDGYYDAGEGEAGLAITATDTTDSQRSYTTTTMTAGGYQMSLASGTYSLTASGDSLTGVASMGTVTIGQENVKVDLEVLSAELQLTTGSIAGVIYHDMDSSVSMDLGETGIEKWTVYVDANDNGSLDPGEIRTTTNSTGGYQFDDLRPDTYTLRYVRARTYRATTLENRTSKVLAGSMTSDVNFGVFEFVALTGNVATVHGTSGEDVILLTANVNHALTVNGVNWSFSSSTVTQIVVDGNGGHDTLTVVGTSGKEFVTLRPGEIEVIGQGYVFRAQSFEEINVSAGTGIDDRVEFVDGATNDRLVVGDGYGLLRSVTGEFYNFASGFDEIRTYATNGGTDYATFHDTTHDDVFTNRPNSSELWDTLGRYYYYATGFDNVYAYTNNGGNDSAHLYDSSSNDRYLGYHDHSIFRSLDGSFYVRADGFEQVTSYATAGGDDDAYLYDGSTDDRFTASSGHSVMRSVTDEFYNLVIGFDATRAYANNGGINYATLYDSPANDQLLSFTDYSILQDPNGSYFNLANGFDGVFAYGTAGGDDVAYMYDGATDDHFVATPDTSVLFDSGGIFYNRVTDFERVYAYARNGGYDKAFLHDSAFDDRLVAGANYGLLRSLKNTYYNYAAQFESLSAYSAAGGKDYATLYDGASNDRFTAYDTHAVLEDLAGSFYNYVDGFTGVFAYATGGSNVAVFVDSSANDWFYGRNDFAFMSGNGIFNRGNGFAIVALHGTNGGANRVDVVDVDYAFLQLDSWF